MNRSPAVRWQMSSLRTKLSVVNFTWMMLATGITLIISA